MQRDVIHTDAAPAAIGPYSQAVRAGEWLFVSGQIPIDPATGELAGEDIGAQTRQVMENLLAVLAAGGSAPDRVVKATLFIADMGQFGEINRIYGEYFPGSPPARACVEVSRLPKDVLVEIEAVALAE